MNKTKLFIQDFSRMENNKFFHGENLICEAPLGEDLKTFAKSCYDKLEMDYPKFHKMDGLCKLGILASELLLRNNAISKDTALVFANNASSLETDNQHQASMDFPSPGVFVYTLPNIVMGEISIKHNLKSENAFFVSESFDPDLLVGYSEILIQTQKAENVLCGWIDLHKNNFEAFLCLVSNQGKTLFNAKNLSNLYSSKNPGKN